MPKIKTTKSAKRYAYSSFKERIDSIKIEPSKKLNRRAFDETETSHFVASYERWSEINRSAVFTGFVESVDSFVQSLPQILHYKSQIFDSLHSHIIKKDPLSLQPLLELLTQFVHDLGPDFMEFYTKTLELIIELALANNDSNTLEWEFNCLAYIFKYLSKYLVQDLIPTFKLLEPLLNAKEHISRFSSEALAFLIRKSSIDELNKVIKFVFNNASNTTTSNTTQYKQAAVTFFSEAMKSTKGSIHSKSSSIITNLLKNSNNVESIVITCDVLLTVINYGSPEAVNELYDITLKQSENLLDEIPNTHLANHLRILTILTFADSGYKVPNWDILVDSIIKSFKLNESTPLSTKDQTLFVNLISILIRNSDVKTLTKYHNTIFKSMIKLNDLFLPFIIKILDLSKQRTLTYASSFIQEFINKNWSSKTQQIALFLEILSERELLGSKDDSEKISIVLSSDAGEACLNQLKNLEITSDKELIEIFWRISILSYSSFHNQKFLLKFFNDINNQVQDSYLKIIILSKILTLLNTEEEVSQVRDLILKNFLKLGSNKEFLKCSYKFINSIKTLDLSNDELIELITVLINNLISPDHEVRINSLNWINILSTKLNDENLTQIANQCLIIEQIPLTLETARDIAIRMRSLSNDFKLMQTNQLTNQLYFKFLFGLLTVRFQPAWEAIWEVLPNTYNKDPSLVWELTFSFINRQNLPHLELSFDFEPMDEDDSTTEWDSLESRFSAIIGGISSVVNQFINYEYSIFNLIETRFSPVDYPEVITSHAIKILTKIPSLAERNAEELETLVFNGFENDDDEENEEGSINLNKKDRNSMLSLFSLFKKLKTAPKADELYKLFLRLLSSKNPDARKIALNNLLNFKNQHVIKYRENLLNLLDDSLFRDEISKLLATGSETALESEDLDDVMPLISRILFARAQSSITNGTKRGIKFAAITSLPNLDSKFIAEFLGFAFERMNGGGSVLENFDESVDQITVTSLRKSNGFFNLLNDILNHLGEKFSNFAGIILPPMINSLVVAQKIIDKNQDEISDVQLLNTARSVRQAGMKDLYHLFQVSTSFDWDLHIESIYESVLQPRFENFEIENLQQPSSLLKILICWSEYLNYQDLLLINDHEPTRKILSLLHNSNTKDEVVEKIIEFSINVISAFNSKKKKFQKLFQIITDNTLESIPIILNRSTSQILQTKSINLLLALVEKGHVQNQEKRQSLVDFSTKILTKPTGGLPKDMKVQILKVLIALVENFEGEFSDIENLYIVGSKFLKNFTDKESRKLLVQLFEVIGEKFNQVQEITSLIVELNSFSARQLNEYDYDRRLAAFRKINDELYSQLGRLEWLPLLNTSLFHVNDEDLSVRTNAGYLLRRFIDSIIISNDDSNLVHIYKDLLLPSLRMGLRSKNESVHFEYVSLLSHIVSTEHFTEFNDMKSLLFHGDEEANFFINVGHIQIHRRQRAIKRLGDQASDISSSNISHYMLPIVERYAFYEDEKFRNISNEANITIQSLMRFVTFKQYQAIFRRYMSGLKEGSETLRDSVNLIIAITKSLMHVVTNKEENYIQGLPKDENILNKFIENEMITPLSKVLNKRDDETVVLRTPLIESLASLIQCLTHERIVSVLPGVLTNICQVLRAKSDETRDATRKYLTRATEILGAKYIKFIISELKTALSRGSQIHVLGFTVHHILSAMTFEHGDLDESSEAIMEIVMENIFGTTGMEKEAENYRTNMKEIKFNKSFDTAEMLTKGLSLNKFQSVVRPIQLLLQERITYKVQNKLDELLRRISSGIHKNDDMHTKEMLILCYELFAESKKDFSRPERKTGKDQSHFLVQLESKPLKVETENSIYIDTFQKLSLELLRVTLNKNSEFVVAENLIGFLPFLTEAINSENEGVIISGLKVFNLIINVEFDTEIDIFKNSARRCLTIIENYPSTESELCQACYKFLSNVIRHKDDLKLKDSSLKNLLIKVQPDLTEQNRQGLAFNFLKALVAKHVMIPEIYDTMDKIREVMVTSHHKERRDMSRSIYFQFIMEYDQGRGRLEKQFKFLVNNLSYPAETGKQSVMELIHLILHKSGKELVEALSSSFFVALAKILISETSTKSREMSIALITSIFEKTGVENYEKYILGWLNAGNSSLLKCSFQLFKIKLKVTSTFGSELDEAVLNSIKNVLESSKAESEGLVTWELVYGALTCLPLIFESDSTKLDADLKKNIIDCLLFPHSWVRLASTRLIGSLIVKEDTFKDDELQNIAYRLVHQLRAPSVDEKLGSQIIKNLATMIQYWETNNTLYEKLKNNEDESDDEEQEAEVEGETVQKMTSWVISKVSGVIRSERNTFISKKSGIQLIALISQILSKERLFEDSEIIMLPLFNLTELESDSDEKQELNNLSTECMKMIENKIGVTEYVQIYSKVRQNVLNKRQERRTNRARLAVTAPEAIARRKIRKHERTREKRRHEKDESGYYHTKKKSQRRG
ncbi:U3 small nucleolar RNA-associated protein [Wickerhamomyces ciferrii]|uniref:U3 small nucleolar RNA-associated protein n=1 Tax=Wickerhamomyces ciferrii (strain ATCC 14091 / BCRC 22168 / CBS 111 / JCM 3599 / NBRC 0793 / NRRL Y-1031 F-60-10) TaxID=1206466 RepID=K0KWB8_WICCF|nr:U3 small nucleolar RNA-associated protein [Wickerhamomyces ciferrii]CCH45453.1 U3 small nucleolar RNA-associated protein [Wickerhamomyces ciferrii]